MGNCKDCPCQSAKNPHLRHQIIGLLGTIIRWSASGAAERANAQSFITELCALLGVEPPRPKTPDEAANAYVFEKTISGSSGSI